MLNVIVIMGRLVADPELRTTPQGTSVTSFRVAVDRNFARQGQERQTDFFDVVAWRGTAEFVSKYFHKGSMIAVEGSMQMRNYQDKNGVNRTAYEIIANNVSFTGSKQESGSGNYAPAPQRQEYSRPVAPAAPSYSAGSNDDFAVIDDNEDLPF